MGNRKRLRDFGLLIGDLPTGSANMLVDVPGVRVGHANLRSASHDGSDLAVLTGVTVVIPGSGNLLKAPLPAAVDIFNGFGKSAGIIQMQELGSLESPIYLCSTLNVGRVWDAAVSIMLDENPKTLTFNPAVFECNDGVLSDGCGRPVHEEHVRAAHRSAAASPFAMGSEGAGSGMRAFGYKGGIGSASRVVATSMFGAVTIGVLTLNNFPGRLRWQGRLIPARPAQEAGSVIVVMGTDAPMAPHLLRRLIRRAWGALGRMGADFAHGSGDIAVGFSLPSPDGQCPERLPWALPATDLAALFGAVMDATEESVWDALLLAGDARSRGLTSLGLRAEELLTGAGGGGREPMKRPFRRGMA